MRVVSRIAQQARAEVDLGHDLGVHLAGVSRRIICTRVFPTLKSSIRDSAMYHQTGGGATSYLAFYFWFHMSLFYWLKIYRNQFPHVKYLWRIEPDVLFSGDISQARDVQSRPISAAIPA